jgi:hypothetical protein
MENIDPMEGLDSEELINLLEAYERSGKRFGNMPEDLQVTEGFSSGNFAMDRLSNLASPPS